MLGYIGSTLEDKSIRIRATLISTLFIYGRAVVIIYVVDGALVNSTLSITHTCSGTAASLSNLLVIVV